MIQSVIETNQHMKSMVSEVAQKLLATEPYDRGEVHAQKITTPDMMMHELMHQNLQFKVPLTKQLWSKVVEPNLPWAEDHFEERVSEEPMNPPPSEAYWPFAQNGNSTHKKDDFFSHTYPERFWPKWAGDGAEVGNQKAELQDVPLSGIRFQYGDLNDLVEVLKNNPRSRQAYLPVWFPEDLMAARMGERVPCTLGYHFIPTQQGTLDCVYPMRSCDFIRFFRDDIYMAGRLLQWVCMEVSGLDRETFTPGKLVMNISNLHCFVGDEWKLKELGVPIDYRNFEALY